MKQIAISLLLKTLCILFLFPQLHTGLGFKGSFYSALMIAFVFSILNYLLSRLITIFTLGFSFLLNLITFGLAGTIFNALILWMVSGWYPDLLVVNGFIPAVLGAFFLGLASYISKKLGS